MKYGNSALLFLVFCSVGGYVCGMSDAPKVSGSKRPFAFSVAPSAQILGIQPVMPVFIPEDYPLPMLKPGKTLIVGNKLFRLSAKDTINVPASTAPLKRKALSEISTTVSKKSETAQQVQRKAMNEIASQQARHQATEETLLAVCNAQSKKRGLGITLMSFPKDLVVDVKRKNRFVEERIVAPLQPNRRLTQDENDAVIGLMGISYGKALLDCL